MNYRVIHTCNGPHGYIYAKTLPAHPKANSNGLYPLHRIVMENKLGSALSSLDNVHHIDRNKKNNAPENLQVLSCADHARIHHPKRPLRLVSLTCDVCDKSFSYPAQRMHEKDWKTICCSKICSLKLARAAKKQKQDLMIK